jgi:hypothetical protein
VFQLAYFHLNHTEIYDVSALNVLVYLKNVDQQSLFSRSLVPADDVWNFFLKIVCSSSLTSQSFLYDGEYEWGDSFLSFFVLLWNLGPRTRTLLIQFISNFFSLSSSFVPFDDLYLSKFYFGGEFRGSF